MSNFNCEHCFMAIVENHKGIYVTGCEHYPLEGGVHLVPLRGSSSIIPQIWPFVKRNLLWIVILLVVAFITHTIWEGLS